MAKDKQIRIRSIDVNNFKSLVQFEIKLAKFTCLIGLNGVGKSTVLQFIDFLSQLVRGDLTRWLDERQWKPRDVSSKLLKKKNVEFTVWFEDEHGKDAGRWEAHYNPSEKRCTWERIDFLDYLLEAEGGKAELTKVRERAPQEIPDWVAPPLFRYEGSILSALKDKFLPLSIRRCKGFFLGAESLDMLTPERLRQRTRSANGTLGHGGRNLSAFVYELGRDGRAALATALKRAYPQLKYVNATSLRSGWQQLHASEVFNGNKLVTEARHLNDGLLRMIAILAGVNSELGFLLFDEIETGISPELVEFVIDTLVRTKQQVVVTTHSPMILNYLDDEVARSGVLYLYKTPEGFTKSIPFFSIPS